MKTQAQVTYSLENGLCRLTLNRPEKLNVLNRSTFEDIAAHLDRIRHENVGCLLLSGSGRSFCAGNDSMGTTSNEKSDLVAHMENEVIGRLASLPYPVIASVRGHCYGSGLELALAADIIIAAQNAQLDPTLRSLSLSSRQCKLRHNANSRTNSIHTEPSADLVPDIILTHADSSGSANLFILIYGSGTNYAFNLVQKANQFYPFSILFHYLQITLFQNFC